MPNDEALRDLWINRSDEPLPDPTDLFLPGFYYVAVMPRAAPEKTSGGLFLSEETQYAEQWLNYVGQIIALGPLAYRHDKWRKMGITDPDNDPRVPKRGEFWCYRPHAPYRMQHKGVRFIALYDDAFVGKVPEGCDPWDYKAGAQ